MKRFFTWNNISRGLIAAAATVTALSGAGVLAIPAVVVKIALGVGIVAAKYLPGHGANAPAPAAPKQ